MGDMGEAMKAYGEMLKQKFVYLGKANRPMHIEAVKSFQLRSVLQCLERGSFYMAVKKESEEIEDVKNCSL